MRATIVISSLFLAASAWAQAPAAPAAPAPEAAASAPSQAKGSARDQKIEHITVEDSGARIDETRYGGQVQTITVKPANGMPSYEVVPPTGTRNRPPVERAGENNGSTGRPVWKIGDF